MINNKLDSYVTNSLRETYSEMRVSHSLPLTSKKVRSIPFFYDWLEFCADNLL